MWWQNYL
jgi:poly(3-hydroxybutyrate) depolymerase